MKLKQANVPYLQKMQNFILLGLMTIITLSFLLQWNLSLNRVNHSETQIELILNAKQFIESTTYLTTEVRSFVATSDTIYMTNYWDEVNYFKNRDISIENMITLGLSDEELAKITQMQELSTSLQPLESEAMTYTTQGNVEDALENVYGPYYSITVIQIKILQEEFIALIEDRTNEEISTLNFQILLLYIIQFIMLILLVLSKTIMGSMISHRRIDERTAELIQSNETLERIVLERTEELQKANDDLRHLSEFDPLTKAYNRFYFEKKIQEVITGFNDNDSFITSLHLCIFDFDNFKSINDTYGHIVGDEQLIEASQIVLTQKNKHTIFCRVGGEEFTLIFVNEEDANVLNAIKQLQLSFEQLAQNPGRTTASFGVEKATKPTDRKSLFQNADQKLYTAKNTGKNKIVSDFI